MTLRDGRADLHQRLTDAAKAGKHSRTGIVTVMITLLEQARDVVLQCPHRDCAYCFTVERKEAG